MPIPFPQKWGLERLRAWGSRSLDLEWRGGAGGPVPALHTLPTELPCLFSTFPNPVDCILSVETFSAKETCQEASPRAPMAPALLPSEHWPPGLPPACFCSLQAETVLLTV